MLNTDLTENCHKILTVMRIYQDFYLSRFGTCRCKATTTTTPEPPKQCKDLEGHYCKNDEECGEGGYCIRWT